MEQKDARAQKGSTAKNEKQKPEAGCKAMVSIGVAAVRAEPKDSAAVAGVVNYGDRLTITHEQDGFCQLTNGLWVRKYAVRKLT